jgi:hypothetical protein
VDIALSCLRGQRPLFNKFILSENKCFNIFLLRYDVLVSCKPRIDAHITEINLGSRLLQQESNVRRYKGCVRVLEEAINCDGVNSFPAKHL